MGRPSQEPMKWWESQLVTQSWTATAGLSMAPRLLPLIPQAQGPGEQALWTGPGRVRQDLPGCWGAVWGHRGECTVLASFQFQRVPGGPGHSGQIFPGEILQVCGPLCRCQWRHPRPEGAGTPELQVWCFGKGGRGQPKSHCPYSATNSDLGQGRGGGAQRLGEGPGLGVRLGEGQGHSAISKPCPPQSP